MRKCEICGTTKSTKLYDINRFENNFTVSRCSDCNFIFMDPFFSDKKIESFYSEDYYVNDGKKQAYTYTDERKNKSGFSVVNDKRVKRILRELKLKNGNGETFLDIGCSFGALISSAKEKEFTISGLDISQYAVDYLKKEGIEAIQGSIDKLKLDTNKQTVVTMIEVIEHLKSPRKAIENIHKSLKKDGLLLIQTANMDGRQATKAGSDYHYFLPGHLHYFSKKTLFKLLDSCGFSEMKIFYPCEFGLLPKLKKSAGNFTRFRDYFKWIRTTIYHLKSKIHFKDFALTSGMVVYARKRE